MLGVSQIAMLFTIIPLLNLFLILLLLIFSGKRYALAFFGVTFLQAMPNIWPIISSELTLIPELMNRQIYQIQSSQIIYHATTQQLAVAQVHIFQIIGILLGASLTLTGFFLFSYFAYHKLRKVLIGRVRGWELRR